MLKEKDNQLSIYSILCNKIPENHILKILRDEIDFSFINEIREDSYCKQYGRPAKELEEKCTDIVLKRKCIHSPLREQCMKSSGTVSKNFSGGNKHTGILRI